MKQTLSVICAAALLAGCSSDAPVRYSAPPLSASDRQRIPYRAVEVRDVTLPRYASEEEIFTEVAGGGISSDPKMLWADDPARAITLQLTRNLGEITGAQVASEPWPFDAYPDVRVEVRAEEMLAGLDGVFRFSGQYFVAPLNGRAGRSGNFDLSAPIPPGGGVPALTATRAALVLDLARLIAREGLR